MSNEAYDANDEDQLDAGAEPSAAREPGQDREDPTVDEHGVTSYYSTRKMRNDVLDGLYDNIPNKLLKRSRYGDYWIVTTFDFQRLDDYNGLMISLGEPVRVPPGSRSYRTRSIVVGGEVIRDVPSYRYDQSVEDVTQPEPEEPVIPPATTSTVTPPPAPTPNPHPTREEVANENNATVNPVTGNLEVPTSPNTVPAAQSVVSPDALDPRGALQVPDVVGPAPITADCNTSSSPAPGDSISSRQSTTDTTDDARAGRTNSSNTTPSTSSQSNVSSTSSSSSVPSNTGTMMSNGPVYQYRPITQFADRYDFKTGKKIRE